MKRAKDKAWAQFSIYIRTRDCLLTTGTSYEGTCVTCNRLYNFKELQAGHWIPGRNNSVLFSDDGVHAQCSSCNLNPPYGKGGNPIPYWIYMENTYGRMRMDELIFESNQTVQYKAFHYDEIAEEYKRKTEKLLETI